MSDMNRRLKTDNITKKTFLCSSRLSYIEIYNSILALHKKMIYDYIICGFKVEFNCIVSAVFYDTNLKESNPKYVLIDKIGMSLPGKKLSDNEFLNELKALHVTQIDFLSEEDSKIRKYLYEVEKNNICINELQVKDYETKDN